MGTIHVTLNYLGIPVKKEFINKLLTGEDLSNDSNYSMLQYFFQFPPQYLSREVLDRYVLKLTDFSGGNE
jgi:hypothetical protein